MKRYALALATFTVAACMAEDRADHFVDINSNNGVVNLTAQYTLGGSLKAYAWKAQRINDRGQFLRIETPVCFSACVYFLAVKKLCVSPRTNFAFHGARNGYVAAATLVPVPDHHANKVVAQDLNDRWPGLGDDYMKNAVHRMVVGDVWIQTGAQLNAKYGVPLCEGN